MNTLLHRDGDEGSEQLSESNDREITLGPTVILGIFLALAALCAVFFGFGYSMGRKTTVTAATMTPNATLASSSFSGFKPAAGNSAGAGDAKAAALSPATVPYTPPPVTTEPRAVEKPADTLAESEPAAATELKSNAHATPSATPPPAAPAVIATGGSTMVQIAAVSHQEDADLLMTTLKRRGYAVAVRSEPQDKLLHVQIGPFPTHKDADTMRQRLLADGFNAIVKDPTK